MFYYGIEELAILCYIKDDLLIDRFSREGRSKKSRLAAGFEV